MATDRRTGEISGYPQACAVPRKIWEYPINNGRYGPVQLDPKDFEHGRWKSFAQQQLADAMLAAEIGGP